MAGTVAALFRLAGAGFVLAREGAFAGVDPDAMPPAPRFPVRLARLIERRKVDGEAERLTAPSTGSGPPMSSSASSWRRGRTSSEATWPTTLGRLRDEIEPFPEAEARATIEKALGKPVDELFATFSPPVAAASIAQVHKAEIVDGRRTAGRRGQGAPAGHPAALPARPRHLLCRRPPRRACRPGLAPAAAGRGGRHARPFA